MNEQPERNRDRFYPYPMHRMAAILDDPPRLDAALHRLQEGGVEPRDVTVLTGPDGARLLDRSGVRHGVVGRLLRMAQWTASENEELELHDEALREGASVVFVPERSEKRKTEVANLLRGAGGHHLVYFGRWTTEKR